MQRNSKFILFLVAVYLLTLMWGQLRLPTATIESLSDYPSLKAAPSLSTSSEKLKMLAIQKWYLKRSMNIVEGNTPPHISVEVTWNFGIAARVHTSYYSSPTGAEGLDGLYICIFGAWFRIHSFMHVMA
jgi:hypothetical protein